MYERPEAIDSILKVLLQLPVPELIARCSIDDRDDPMYVPSECVLYFVRRPPPAGGDEAFRTLFMLLRQRVRRAVRVTKRRLPGTGKVGESDFDLGVRDSVVGQFQIILCRDLQGYDDRLDFFECRFDGAIANLRRNARRDAGRATAGQEPLYDEGDSNSPSPEVEAAFADMKGGLQDGPPDFLYRSKLRAVIDSLPDNERRVLELRFEGVPIDPDDKSKPSIVKYLKCSEKSVRIWWGKATERIREAMKEDGE